MTFPTLVAFDLDDTLAASKSPIDPLMGALLGELLTMAEVCVISGGQIAQFTSQLVDNLPPIGAVELARLHLMPTCGTQYYRHRDGAWQQVYAQNLTDDERRRALETTERVARRLGYWESET